MLNVETFYTKEARQKRVQELKGAHTPHVCQHTNCIKKEEARTDENGIYHPAVWISTYSVSYPPPMASLADVVKAVSDPNDPVVTSEPLPDTQAIAAAEGEGMVTYEVVWHLSKS